MEDLTPPLQQLQGREIAGLAAYEEEEIGSSLHKGRSGFVRTSICTPARIREFKYTGDDNFYNSNDVDALEKAGIIWLSSPITTSSISRSSKRCARQRRRRILRCCPASSCRSMTGPTASTPWSFFPTTGWPMAMTILTPSWALRLKEACPVLSRKRAFLSSLLETIKKLAAIIATFSLSLPMSKHRSGLWAELDGDVLPSWARTIFRRRTLGFQKVRTYNKQQEKSNPAGPNAAASGTGTPPNWKAATPNA